MKSTLFASFLTGLLMVCLTLSGCSTHTGNPENTSATGDSKITIQFSTASVANLESLSLCPAKVEFYSSSASSENESDPVPFEFVIPHPANFVTINPQGITIYGSFEYTLPESQSIARIDLTLAVRCNPNAFSALAINSSGGRFAEYTTFKIVFYGGYVTRSGSTLFTFDMTNFMAAASKLTDPEKESLKDTLTATSGYFSAQ